MRSRRQIPIDILHINGGTIHCPPAAMQQNAFRVIKDVLRVRHCLAALKKRYTAVFGRQSCLEQFYTGVGICICIVRDVENRRQLEVAGANNGVSTMA